MPTTQEIVHELVDEVPVAASVENVRKILGERKARINAFESFARSYLAFHAACLRYCSKEIIDCKYMID